MHITIVAIGSRGDIQPYIALGQGLQQAGHCVRLNTHLDFEALVRQHGLEFAPLHGNVRDKKLTAANLAEAIGLAVNDQTLRRRAARIGELIRGEDGVRRAVEIFQRYYA